MVRKWSYVTYLNSTGSFYDKSALTKCYSFKVFRMTTRFKKYKRYETTFVRKKDATRKRQTSWFTLTVVLGQWSLQYLKSRQNLRYLQTMELVNYKLQIPNTYVLMKKLPLLNDQLSFTTMRNSLKFFKNPSSTILLNEMSMDLLKETNVSNLIYENHLFRDTDPTNFSVNFDFTLLTQSLLTWHVSYTIEVYKILILLTLQK